MDFKQFVDREHGDIMGVFYDSDSFHEVIDALAKPLQGLSFTKVVSIEARGFMLGSAVAYKLNKAFVPARREGKLKKTVVSTPPIKDYTGAFKTFQIQTEAISHGDTVVIVDDWIETANQLRGVIALIQSLGAKVVGISVIFDETSDQVKRELESYNYNYLVSDPS